MKQAIASFNRVTTRRAFQRGVVSIMTAFVILMTIGAFAVLGLGQVVWNKEEVQRIADLAAKAAASDIENASAGFQAARDYASLNGFNAATDTISINCNVKGTNTVLAPASCQQSVLVSVVRNVSASFIGDEPIQAIAEATVTPFISGIVGSNLLALNTSGGALSPLFADLGTRIGLSAVGFSGLLASDTQVDLLDLGVQLGVFNSGDALDMADLLAANVTGAQLLNAALAVAGPSAPSVTIPNSGVLNSLTFPISRILSTDSTDTGTMSGASLRLGNLAFATSLAAATALPADAIVVNTPGNFFRISILEPPKAFVARKRVNSGAVLATGTTEQVRVNTKINGLVDLSITTGGGQVEIRDIECRLPQSNSAVNTRIVSTPLSANIAVPTIPTFLLSPATVSAVSASNVMIDGYPNPVLSKTYSFQAQQGLGQIATGLQSSVTLLNLVLTIINIPLKNALNQVGGVVDLILQNIGLNLNQVVVEIDNMDCFNTAVLTR